MRKGIILAAGLGLLIAKPAAAQIPVTDVGAIAQAMLQVQQGVQQIAQLTAQLQQLQATYESLTHLTSIGTMIPALGTTAVANPMPSSAWTMQEMFSGVPGGPLSALQSQNYSNNLVYAPPTSTWLGQHLTNNANSIAGAQAASQQLYSAISQRIPLMQQLLAQLSVASQPKDVMDLQARIQAEQAFIQSQQVQATTLNTWFNAQMQSEQQQLEERRQQQIAQLLASAPTQ